MPKEAVLVYILKYIFSLLLILVEEIEPGMDTSIPGLDSSAEELARLKPQPQRKVPYAKPIPDDFQKAWDKMKAPGIAPQVSSSNWLNSFKI